MKRKASPNCDTCDLEESNLHMFYFCKEKKVLVKFLRELLKKCLNKNSITLVRLLFLDTSDLHRKDSNAVISLLTSFICTIWYNRENPGNKLNILKRTIITKQRFQKIILRDKMPKIFNNQYCKINMNFLDNICVTNS